MIKYAYSDETEFKLSESDSEYVIGTGFLITQKEINETVIRDALNCLESDSEKNSKDFKTLKRGFFHASEDSPNAHSHLCHSINKHVSGCFRYSYYDRQKRQTIAFERTNENIKRLTLELSALELFYKKIDKVFLTIETRNGFSVSETNNWLKSFYRLLDGAAYDQPSYLTFYPEIILQSSGKSSPGLQVVDFLLWSLNRSIRNTKDLTWKNRLNFKISAYHYQEGSAISGGDYYLNEIPTISNELAYPFHIYDSTSIEEFYESYVTIEKQLRQLCKTSLPTYLSHFDKQFTEVKNLFKYNKEFLEENLTEVASLYLRLFDSLPIYGNLENNDYKNWTNLLRAKKTAGLLIRKDLIQGYRSAMEILDWREEIYKSNNESIFFSAD